MNDTAPWFDGLPDLRAVERRMDGAGRTLIVAAGFEDRALASALSLNATQSTHAIVLHYLPENPKNRLEEIVDQLKRAGIAQRQIHSLDYDRYSPAGFDADLTRVLTAINSRRVLVDISTMSKLTMLLTLDVCRELNLKTDVYYAEAATYGPSRKEYEDARDSKDLTRPSIQASTGVFGVLRVARLSSVAMQGQPTAAIAFMSFNEALAQALVNSVYPSRLILINGRPPKHTWREAATSWIHEHLRSEWSDHDNPLLTVTHSEQLPAQSTSTLDYRETVVLLRELYWGLSVSNRILVAPTGSKMQTLGCFVLRSIHPDIHMEYPTPKGFLQLYSEGIGKQWTVSFGRLGEWVESARRAEQETLEIGS